MTNRSKLGWAPCRIAPRFAQNFVQNFVPHLASAIILVVAVCVSGWTQAGSHVGAASTIAVAGSVSTVAIASRNEDEDNADQPILTITKRVDEVNVLFIATDRHGKFVRNLNQNDFSILDDHKPVETILNFRRETDLPLHMGLLIDVSGSVNGRFDFEQGAATSFLEHTLRAGFDKAFICA